MASNRKAATRSAVHLWICDQVGGVHVLCHVTSNPVVPMKWRQLEESSAYRCIVGGANICSISEDGEMFVRDKIKYSDPLGKAWLPTRYHVNQLSIGNHYIVAVLQEGGALIGNISRVRSSSYCPIKWEEITPPTPPKLAHIAMTTSDFLYGVTEGGDTYGCHGIPEDTRPITWEMLTKPPILSRRGFLANLFKSSPRLLFDHVTCSAEGLWCYTKCNDTLWLLSNQQSTNQIAWKSYTLPSHAPKLTSISGHPHNLLTLYGITECGKYLYEIQGKEAEPTLEITELPYHGHGDIVMATISCCMLYDEEEEEEDESLYPKLPKRSKEEVMNHYTIDNYQRQAINKERKRTRSDYNNDTKRIKEDTDYDYMLPYQQTSLSSPAKTKMYRHPFTHKLIRDIPVTIVTKRRVRHRVPHTLIIIQFIR